MLRRLAFAAALIALYCGAVVTTNGCGIAGGGRPTPPDLSARIEGQVTDAETGAHLEGVQLSVQGHKAITDRGGNYSIRDLDARRSLLTAALQGYEVYQADIVLRNDRENVHDFVMRHR